MSMLSIAHLAASETFYGKSLFGGQELTLFPISKQEFAVLMFCFYFLEGSAKRSEALIGGMTLDFFVIEVFQSFF